MSAVSRRSSSRCDLQQRRFIREAAVGTRLRCPAMTSGEGLLRKLRPRQAARRWRPGHPAYRQKLQEAGLVDLIGVRGLAKTELERARNEDAPLVLPKDGRRIWHLIVDELQDTSLDQLKLILAFAAHAGVSAAGDDDQSIYAFRGAVGAVVFRQAVRRPQAAWTGRRTSSCSPRTFDRPQHPQGRRRRRAPRGEPLFSVKHPIHATRRRRAVRVLSVRGRQRRRRNSSRPRCAS